MLHTITARERYELLNTSLAFREVTATWLPYVSSALIRHWSHDLGPVKLSIMLCLAELSIGKGRGAVELSRDSLANGAGDDFPGLGITARSARTHVDGLCQAGFLDIYRVVSYGKTKEGSASVIEINVKKVLETGSNDLGKFFLGLHRDIYRYEVPSEILQSLGKPKLLPTRFAASDPAENLEISFTRKEVSVPYELPTPKKQRAPAPRREETVAAVLAATSARIARTKAIKVEKASGPVSALTGDALQTLIDKNMKEYMPSHPRMLVTRKPFGVLKARLVKAELQDLPDFINWVIRSWGTIATQNQAAYLKDPSKVKRGTPLPQSPAFITLAYKLPYFLAAYSNRLSTATKTIVNGKTAEQRKIEQLTAQLRVAQEEAAVLRRTSQRRRVSMEVVPERVPLAEPAHRTQEDDLPVWSERRKA